MGIKERCASVPNYLESIDRASAIVNNRPGVDRAPRDRISRVASESLDTFGIVLCHRHLLRAGARKVSKMHTKSPPPPRFPLSG